MKTANGVIYARYSSHNQKETSIEDQVRVCEEYAKRHDINIIKVYPDKATSGRTDKRRHFQDMIEDSYYGNFQYVITYKLDRFARNRIDSAKYRSILKSNGVKLLSAMENLSDDPSSIILEGVLEAMAEHYSANLSQNIRRGMDSNAEKCLCTGGNRTLGYQVIDKKFHLDPVTAPIVRNIFEMYAKGHTQAEILRYLNSKHLKTAYGNEFGKNSVAYILKNKRYAGYYTYNGKEKKGGIPAIVSEELFDACQKLMAKNKKAPAKTKAKNGIYLLSGSMVCGYCGRNVTGISGTSKSGGKTHYYYSCASHSGKCKCELKNRRRADLEEFVIAHTLKILTPERIEYIAKKVVALCEKERNDKSEITALEKELRKVKKEARNLLTAIKANKAKQILLDELEQLEEQQQEIKRQIERERIRIPALTVDKVKFFMERFASGDIKDPYFREKLINTFVNKIELYNDKIAITYNIGDGYLHDKHVSICICPYLVEAGGVEPPSENRFIQASPGAVYGRHSLRRESTDKLTASVASLVMFSAKLS